ncbi:hypothetical protein V2J09_011956 [Rumex salicifolius]
MLPNLDLILLSILHCTLICCILLTVISFILIILSLALTFGLFSLALLDLYNVTISLSFNLEALKADLQLVLLWAFCTLLRFGIMVLLALKPGAHSTSSKRLVKLQQMFIKIKHLTDLRRRSSSATSHISGMKSLYSNTNLLASHASFSMFKFRTFKITFSLSEANTDLISSSVRRMEDLGDRGDDSSDLRLRGYGYGVVKEKSALADEEGKKIRAANVLNRKRFVWSAMEFNSGRIEKFGTKGA